MWKKQLCLAVVLALGLVGSIASGDITSGLVGYWPLDGDARDVSGNGLNGTIVGNVQFVEDRNNLPGAAALFPGVSTSYIDLGNPEALRFNGAMTLAAWARVDNFETNGRIIARQAGTNQRSWTLNIEGEQYGHVGAFHIASAANTSLAHTTKGRIDFSPDEWFHIAGVYRPSQAMEIYINGQLDNILTEGVPASQFINTQNVNIGRRPNGTPFAGSIDDVYVFNRSLSAADILQLAAGEPGVAADPSPANEATDVPRDVVLSWTPGEFAPPINGHIVYFSESFSNVNDGVGGIAQDASSYAPGRLDFETTYYWRIDEVNAPPDSTVFPGEVWSFATEPVAYPIGNVTATASSSGVGKGPENTVNGSGLDGNDLHSTNETQMWLSGVETNGAWIHYEFEKVHKLHQMLVWNHNTGLESAIGFGIKEATIEYSVNGSDWTALGSTHEFARALGLEGYAHNTTIDFGGVAARYVRLAANSNWGGLLKQYGLSEVRFFSVPVSAREPLPDSGAADVGPDVTLSWRAGREAGTHNVYVSTDEQAVIDGTTPVAAVIDTSYSSVLDLAGTYYWRIDEVNDVETPTTWQGDVWSFSTPEYLVVDDFEDYNDYPPDEIFSTWIDGWEVPANGALAAHDNPPFAETTIVHGGVQSMPLLYSNTGTATYSEAARTFAAPQDWTKYGIQTLGLWFHGAAGNTGQLYVKINGSKIPYDGNAANLAIAAWQAWNIDLTTLGVNLQTVTTLAVGIDGNTAAGTLYVDDVRLYAFARQLITPVQPSNANLAGHWPFDEGSGTTVRDSSGNNSTGTLVGAAEWVAGMVGSALRFEEGEYVDVGPPTPDVLKVQQDITIAVWCRPHQILAHWQVLLSMQRGSSGGEAYAMTYGNNTNRLTAIFNTAGGNGNVVDPASFVLDEWIHAAVTYDGDKVVLYRNGQPVAENSDPFSGALNHGDGLGRFAISGNYNSLDGGLREHTSSTIDDVRIYGRALPQEEIAWLAGRTQPFDKPF